MPKSKEYVSDSDDSSVEVRYFQKYYKNFFNSYFMLIYTPFFCRK